MRLSSHFGYLAVITLLLSVLAMSLAVQRDAAIVLYFVQDDLLNCKLKLRQQ